MNLKNKLSPVTALTIGAIIISFSSILVKTSHVPSSVSAFYRVMFGGLFLVGASFLRKEFRNRPIKKVMLAVLCGLIFAVDLWAWHLSIHYIGPGLATILGNCQVFILALVGVFLFKETLGPSFIISLPLVFWGLFLIIGVDMDHLSQDHIIGIVLGVLTALSYSMFLLILRKLQSDPDDFSLFYYLTVVSLSSALFIGCGIIASGTSFAIPNTRSLLSLLCLGIVNQGLAWIMISNALPRVNASHAGLILLLQPALSFVWDVLFFNRPTGITGWAGVVIALAAIYLGMSGKKQKTPSSKTNRTSTV